MVKVKEDLTGKSFDRLTVLYQTEDHIEPSGRHVAMWVCKCSCNPNKTIIASGRNLRRGVTKSCGCLFSERMIEFNKRTKKKYNKYDLSGEYGIGWTSNTNREFYFDLEDYNKIKDYCWAEVVDGTGYHYLTSTIINDDKSHTTIRMHNLIVKYNLCDHKDRNPFNNIKANLRDVSYSENAQNRSLRSNNTSGFVGVSWDKHKCCWISYLDLHGQRVYLEKFSYKIDAIKARLYAELKYFGVNFAPQRHLFEMYGITSSDNCEENL